VPGCFFGMPAILSIAPSVVATAATGSSVLLSTQSSLIAIGTGSLLLFSWGLVLAGNETLALWLFSMRACAISPVVGMWLVENNAAFGDAARAQAHLTLLSWFVALIPTLLIKHVARRRRPVVCDVAALGEATAHAADLKRLRIIPRLLGRDANAAFPSGDAVGALVFAHALHRCGHSSWGCACAFGSCVGRIYWHAHHALDVAVGAAIGLGTSMLLSSLGQRTVQWCWWHGAVAQAVLTLVALACGTTKTIMRPDHHREAHAGVSERGGGREHGKHGSRG